MPPPESSPPNDACPCGAPLAYDACCGPLHRGEKRAETPEALMRSRYAAFCKRDADYLVGTLHPSKRRPGEKASLQAGFRGTRWTGLTVLEASGGGPGEKTGTVTFEARYVDEASPGVMRERSRFVLRNGAWLYVDGEPG